MAKSKEKLNIALIGCGGRGLGVRLPAILLMSDRFNLVAVCDVDEEKAGRIAAEQGVNAYSRVQDLVANEHLDVAAVSTPMDSHHAVGAYLAEHGVNLIVETPIAPTLPMTDVLIKAVDRNGVKMEIAEQYCRDPLHQIKRLAIDQGLIGTVLRVYALFQTGGYHIVSSVRMMVGNVAASRVMGLVMDSPIPQVNVSEIRQFSQEHWTLDIVEFENGATALTSYSALYHGRALGRKSKTLFQVDGTTGTIVEDEVHITTEEQRLNGGRATVYPIQTVTRSVDEMQVLERMEIASDPPVVWENPWPQYKTSPGGLAIVEEMDSIALAVLEDRPTRYDGLRARQDIEVQIASEESGRLGRKPIDLPLQAVTGYEQDLLDQFRRQYGCDPFDIEQCIDVFFPKR